MKKVAMILCSMFLIFGTTSCTQPASQPVKEEVKEQDKGIYIANEDVVDMFPQLKEVREYLLDNYPLTRKEQEKQIARTKDFGKLPIKFYYVDRVADGKYEKKMVINLFFEETVTKKQMVEAINYASEKMKEIFPADDEVLIRAVAFVGYTKDGVLQKDMWLETEAFSITFKRNVSEDVLWRIRTAPDEWVAFDPNSVKEGEKPKSFVEQPEEQQPAEPPTEQPAQTSKGIEGVKLSELKQFLADAEVEEFSFEENGGSYTSTGIDSTKTYGYTAVTGSDKETVQGIVYMITKKENLTDEQYLELCKMYLTAGATYGYEGVSTTEAADFIENNMETVLTTGEAKTQTMGDLSFMITYAEGTASLIILNANEQ